MINGREVSKANIWNLKQNLARLYAKQIRISDQIIEAVRLIAGHEYDKGQLDAKCWSCKQTNRDTTDLTMCELSNTLYPLACDEFEVKEK